jgi:hypothetical protein
MADNSQDHQCKKGQEIDVGSDDGFPDAVLQSIDRSNPSSEATLKKRPLDYSESGRFGGIS